MGRRYFFGTLIFIAALSAVAQPGNVFNNPGRTWYVNPVAGESISNVIRFVQYGDTIFIGPGTNYVTLVNVPAGVTLRGAGQRTTWLIGTPVSYLGGDIVRVHSNCLITDLAICDTNLDGTFRYPITPDGLIDTTNVTLSRLYLNGKTDVIIGPSTGVNVTMNVYDCDIYSAWDCVNLACSGANGGFINFYACSLYSDNAGGILASPRCFYANSSTHTLAAYGCKMTANLTNPAGNGTIVQTVSGATAIISGCSFDFTPASVGTLYSITPISSGTGYLKIYGCRLDRTKIRNGAPYKMPIYMDNLNSQNITLQGPNFTVSSATPANVGMTTYILAGVTNQFDIRLMVNESVTAEGIAVTLNAGAAIAANLQAQVLMYDSTGLIKVANVTALATSTANANFNGTGMIHIIGNISSAFGGTFGPQLAQNSHTTGTVTCFAGSSMIGNE